ncbi:hypothetical protein E2562_020649, partial [Oryza meyeriana var. granulata]
TVHLQYPLLQLHYDTQHRAYKLLEKNVRLKPLRAQAHTPLLWDERYAYYIRRVGFLPLARIVNVGLPQMDHSVLTAMVDHWRPETHTFHLVCGELTVALQDVAMKLGLLVEGEPAILAWQLWLATLPRLAK